MKRFFFVVLLVLLTSLSVQAAELSDLSAIREGSSIIGLHKSGYVNSVVLTAGSAEGYAVPTGAKYFLPSCTTDTWFAIGGGNTVTVPSSAVTNGSSPLLNPGLRALDGATTLGIIAPAASKCSIEYWK